MKGAIAYQTVQAKANIPGKPEVKYRMLLDTGCDRTYIHQSFADKLGGKPVRFERKVSDTVHGDKVRRCAIYNLEVKDLKGVLQCTTEAVTLSKLTSVRNVRQKILKERYQHLKDLEFSDVSDEEELDVHVIQGLEDLCKLRTGKMVWGESGEPVAEQTKLGWTLLGPVELAQNNTHNKKSVMLTGEKLFPADQLEKLWDLDTVGIREGLTLRIASSLTEVDM